MLFGANHLLEFEASLIINKTPLVAYYLTIEYIYVRTVICSFVRCGHSIVSLMFGSLLLWHRTV